MDAILMNKNTEILRLTTDEQLGHFTEITEVYHLDYMPIGIPLEHGVPSRARLYKWWSGRSIPASRDGLADALFHLNVTSPQELIMKSFGLSLSDQYWLKPVHCDITWSKVNFFENNFSTDVGDAFFAQNFKRNVDLKSPDNTSDGWLKKKWVAQGRDRLLLKSGSGPFKQEPFNELLAAKMLERLNFIPFVPYELIEMETGYCSACRNFITTDTEFVPAFSVYNAMPKLNHESELTHMLNCAQNFSISAVKEFLDAMIICDFLIVNSDRHWGNFGFIRNVNSLEFEGPAPLFDHGTSMWNNSVAIAQNHEESKPFKATHTKQLQLVEPAAFERFDLARLKGLDQEWESILCLNPNIDAARRRNLVRGLLTRIDRLQRYMEKQRPVQISRSDIDR